ncbi:MAG: Glu-tRNA(Gln) amidotransferase subunit GatD [Thermoplasmata archaeon]|nr:Glu-tRNA(Gln) amidotransferase subunit GatD [Thermoplasmata archaeon]
MSEEYQPPDGYRGPLLERLVKEGLRTWSVVRVTKKDGSHYEGVLLPRSVHTSDDYISIKVDTGYNIGIRVPDDAEIIEIGYRAGDYKIPEKVVEKNPDLPNVTLLGTGGTVASRLDYRTGAVLPAFEPSELFSAVPELIDICNLTPKTLYKILSENFCAEYWIKTAEAVAKEINDGADGVIIGHGTDTMSYTGSALSFFFRNLPIPVVIVGSQRSSDRPSSDGPINMMNASTLAAYGDLAEVVVVMHGTTSDNYDLIHRATRVRKMHSARRDTFRTVGDTPLGKIKDREITFFKDDRKRRGPKEDFVLDTKIDERVTMLYFYPGMESDAMEAVIDKGYHGIVIIGTGLGHVGKPMYEALDRAHEEEIPVVIVVQPLFGFTHLRVYETGRDMLARGVIEGKNMLPEAALPKLMWALGHTRDVEEVRKIMQTNIAGEITTREMYSGFPILQGGVENFYDVFKKIDRVEK